MTQYSSFVRLLFNVVGLLILSALFAGCGGAGGSFTSNQNRTNSADSSMVDLALSPDSGVLETGQTIDFRAPFRGSIQWSVNGLPGGSPVFGTIDSSGLYTAPAVPPSTSVTVAASLSRGRHSNAFDLTAAALTAAATIQVVNPAPTITQLSPNSVPLGNSHLKMTVSGNGFNPASKVAINDQTLPTTFVDAANLIVDIPALILSTAGVWPVRVSNDAPGGGSFAVPMVVLNPIPVLVGVSPAQVVAGSGGVSILLSGSGFIPQSSITAGGHPLDVISVDPQHISTALPGSLITSTGQLALTVSNPAPGGGPSAIQEIAVVNPLPVLNQISPSSLIVGSSDSTLSISGSGFSTQSQVLVNGQAVGTTFGDSQRLIATVPAAMITATGDLGVIVSNPAPGGRILGCQADYRGESHSHSESDLLGIVDRRFI